MPPHRLDQDDIFVAPHARRIGAPRRQPPHTLVEILPNASRQGFWALTLPNGFWIPFSTHLGKTDLLVRTTTDLTWTGSQRARAWTRGRASVIYYVVLAAFSCRAAYTIRFGRPFALFKIRATVAGFVLAAAGLQILIANRRFLPRALRPPLYRELLLLLCVCFYGFFSVRVFLEMLG